MPDLKFIDWNGQILDESSPVVSVKNQGFYYGFSIYETIYIKSSKPAFYSDHIDRLNQSIRYFQFTLDPNFYRELKERIDKLIKIEKIEEGRLRFILSQNGKEITSGIMIERIEVPVSKISLFLSSWKKPFPPVFPSYVKLSSNLISLFSIQEAKKNGFDEALLLTNNGFLSEGSYCNIFFWKNNKLFTPSSDCALLEGVTRAKILDSARELNLELELGFFKIEELLEADRVYISSSTRGLIPVYKINQQEFSIEPIPDMKKLQDLYEAKLADSLNTW